MALSEKKAITDKKHLDKLDKMKIQPYKVEGAKIRAAAEQAGQSLQGYILQAVRTRMKADEEGAGEVKNIEVYSSSTYPDCYYISTKEKKELRQLLIPHIQSVPLEDRAELERRLVSLIHETFEEAGENSNECPCRSLIDIDK